jgi:hypothetical protein
MRKTQYSTRRGIIWWGVMHYDRPERAGRNPSRHFIVADDRIRELSIAVVWIGMDVNANDVEVALQQTYLSSGVICEPSAAPQITTNDERPSGALGTAERREIHSQARPSPR